MHHRSSFATMTRHLLCVSLLAALSCVPLTGCRTPTPPQERATAPTIAMEDDPMPAWKRQAVPRHAREIELEAQTFAFDGFVLRGDEEAVESIWLVIYPLLGWLANQARGTQAEPGYLALMSELEPFATGYDAPTQIEVSFLMSKMPGTEAWREGLGFRLWRHVDARTPTLSLILWQSSTTPALSSVSVWTHPDVMEASSSALVTDADVLILPGTQSINALRRDFTTTAQAVAQEASWLPLLRDMLWTRFEGPAYLDSPLRLDSPSPLALHEGLRPMMGLEVRERDIDEVLPQTSFMPRLDVDDVFKP